MFRSREFNIIGKKEELNYLRRIGLESISIQLTKKCNQDCIICGQAVSRKIKKDVQFLDKETVVKVLEDAKKLRVKRITFTGGEPTIHPDILELVELSNKMGLDTMLITNGLNLTKNFSKKLVEGGLQNLGVSLHHSGAKVHDRITGVRGSWAKVINGIGNIKAINKNVNVSILFTIHSLNYKDSFHMLLLARGLEASSASFSLTAFEPHIDKKLKLSINQMKVFYFLIVPSLLLAGQRLGIFVKIEPIFKDLMGKPPEEQVSELIIENGNFEDEIKNFTRGVCALGKFDRFPCIKVLKSSRIQANGEVALCCDSDCALFQLGNVKKRRFIEIWNSSKYKKIRDVSNVPKFQGCAMCRTDFDPRYELMGV